MQDYNLFSCYRLSDIQQEAVSFVLNKVNCIINLGVGCGKSLVALTAGQYMVNADSTVKVVILTTKSSWVSFMKEVNKTQISASVTNKRSFDSSFYFIQRSQLAKEFDFFTQLASNYRVMLFIDEGHELSNPKSQDYQRVLKLRQLCEGCCILTGTPLLNHIEGLYHVVDLVVPKFFKSVYAFINEYVIRHFEEIRVNGVIRNIPVIDGYCNLDKLSAKLEEICFTRSRSYKVTPIFYEVSLDESLFDMYRKATQGITPSISDKMFAQRLHDLQQIVDASHEEYPFVSKVTLKEKKFLQILKGICDKNESALVYCEYLSVIDRLTKVLKQLAPKVGLSEVKVITGALSTDGRKAVAENLKPKSVVLMTRAGSQSLNLQKANHVIIYDIPFAVAYLLQVIGRVTRMDTKFDEIYVHMIETKGTIDTYRRILIQDRLFLIDEVFGGKTNTYVQISRLDRDNLKYLKRKLLWSTSRQILQTS